MAVAGKLTRKCQVTVPKEIRRALRLKPGDRVFFAVEGGRAVLRPAPGSYAESIRGLGKAAWRALGGGDRFLRAERDSWR